MTRHSPVLITGCSSGIGEATALRLVEAGHTVYATARRSSSLSALAAVGAVTRDLDVTDEGSMRAVVDEIVAEHGRIGALVNNSGHGAYGAVEDAPPDAVRKQFDTNVFGMARMIQLALPSMRAARSGRIVNISSTGGGLTFPFAGHHHTSKYAVEAMSDGLRFEVTPFGVTVSVVEHGLIATENGDAALSTSTPGESPYREATTAVDKSMAKSFENRLSTAGPDAVAEAVEHATAARHPRTRYVITPAARSLITIRALTPGRAWDRVASGVVGR